MLRRRRPPAEGYAAQHADNDEPKKGAGKHRPRTSIRVLLHTLVASVWFALNPAPEIRSLEYSEFLTSRVASLTIGWHIFRTVTEGAFLASYGLGWNTIVVQMFWSVSVGSTLLHLVHRPTWLRARESLCVYTNCMYGFITVLKICHLVPRLPNENNYMFKHCFLTMADAAFSQTAVHKQFAVQFAEAAIRTVVWRCYHVLPDMPMPGIVAISLAWQLWLLAFASMLQAKHVSAFRRQRPAASTAASAAASTSAASTSRSAESAVATTTAATSAPAAPPAPAASDPPSAPATVTSTSSVPMSAPASVSGLSPNTTGGTDTAASLSGVAGGAGLTPAQQRYMSALRSVARGPSSYVLLSHQRKQSGTQLAASAQFYIPAASPDMLPHNWRERLASAVAEGSGGWQLASACVRTGSLIVHLDLVYAPGRPRTPTTSQRRLAAPHAGSSPFTADAGTDAGAGRHTASGEAPPPAGGVHGLVSSSAAHSSSCSPFYPSGLAGASSGSTAYPSGPRSSEDSRGALDDYLSGMSAESLMKLLGLPPDLPPASADAPVSVQLGDVMRSLPSSDNLAADAAADAAAPADADVPDTDAAADATAGSVAAVGAAAAAAPAALPRPFRQSLAAAVAAALSPPADLRSAEYVTFLAARVGSLHLAYSAFMVITAAVFCVLRAANGIRPFTLALFMAAELLTLAAHAAAGRDRWRSVRCQLVYAGVVGRTLQMAACTTGVLPHMLRDTDCVSHRWMQKVLMITTLQALCMQSPVRSFFAVRLPAVLLALHTHVVVCDSGLSVGGGAALHLGWEGVMFLISAYMQLRHLEAFRASRLPRREAGFSKASSYAALTENDDTDAAASTSSHASITTDRNAPAAATATTPAATVTAIAADPTPAAASRTISASGAAVTSAAPVGGAVMASGGAAGDPQDVSLSSPLIALSPRRSARLELCFTCAPAVVDELQIVLRHINPASMSSGVHAAHAARDIAHALVAPVSAAGAPPHLHAAFIAELALVAAPADMPGLVHVEIWRGRRRICSHPTLLIAAPAASAASDAATATAGSSSGRISGAVAADAAASATTMGMLRACADRVSKGHHDEVDTAFRASADGAAAANADNGAATESAAGGGNSAAAAAVSLASWLDDFTAYVGSLQAQGHGVAAAQFVEELGGWLAQVAAVERGLTAATNAAASGAATTATVANVLYFHGLGSEFMYLKPKAAGGRAAAAAESANGGGSASAADSTFRQMLLSQGGLLLAVAVEAGCVALSNHLMGLLAGGLGADLRGVMDAARTPVTQLPLLHAAVKSGSVTMVDLVADWCTSSGVTDPWTTEAAVMAISLEQAGAAPAGGQAPAAAAVGPGAASARSSFSTGRRTSRLAAVSDADKDADKDRLFRAHERQLSACAGSHSPGSTGIGTHSLMRLVMDGAGSGSSSGGNDHAAHSDAPVPAVNGGGGGTDEADAALVADLLAGCGAAPRDSHDSLLLTQDVPFKVIAVRGSRRASALMSAPFGGDGGVVAGSAADADAGCAAADRRPSFEDLFDGGVIVLTPLHLALALGDEGRLVNHILRTYPEAYEVWRMSQQDGEANYSSSSLGTGPCDAPGGFASGASGVGTSASGNDTSCVSASAALAAAAAAGLAAPLAPSGLSVVASLQPQSFSSLPGLGCGSRRNQSASAYMAGGGGGREAGQESLEYDSLQSMSLSDVAFLEGMRWVDEEAAYKRPAFKVTRM